MSGMIDKKLFFEVRDISSDLEEVMAVYTDQLDCRGLVISTTDDYKKAVAKMEFGSWIKQPTQVAEDNEYYLLFYKEPIKKEEDLAVAQVVFVHKLQLRNCRRRPVELL